MRAAITDGHREVGGRGGDATLSVVNSVIHLGTLGCGGRSLAKFCLPCVSLTSSPFERRWIAETKNATLRTTNSTAAGICLLPSHLRSLSLICDPLTDMYEH